MRTCSVATRSLVGYNSTPPRPCSRCRPRRCAPARALIFCTPTAAACALPRHPQARDRAFRTAKAASPSSPERMGSTSAMTKRASSAPSPTRSATVVPTGRRHLARSQSRTELILERRRPRTRSAALDPRSHPCVHCPNHFRYFCSQPTDVGKNVSEFVHQLFSPLRLRSLPALEVDCALETGTHHLCQAP